MNWFSNIITSDRKKRDTLRDLIDKKLNIEELGYFTLSGGLEGIYQRPDYNYLLINSFLRNLGTKEYKRYYKEFKSGCLQNIKLVIQDGNITTYEELIP